ncbi:MAG TPA: histone deacetylase family protein [Rhodospirillaceae bacterium]|nr:histone deacetylase family protein [Rhodospirillaceae bacterium]
MTTLLLSHPACLRHDTGEFHPETAERLAAILHMLEHEDFIYLARGDAPPATREQLLRAHSQAHIDRILGSVPAEGCYIELDSDTILSSTSGEAILRSAGAACYAIDEVMTGRIRNVFCAVRPPGHHAEREQAGGFCLFSNAAIAALHARDGHGAQRVAVVDFDVHHGNGTQNILWNEAGMFYASTHQSETFPYTGFSHETGSEGGARIVNVPMPPGTGSEAFREAYTNTILPALRDFAPDVLIISAGFDAHAADPMAHFRLQVSDFTWVTNQLLDVARTCCQRRVVSLLEGGYDPRALAACVAAHLRALMEA